jgi:hypothetical protein
MIALAFAVAMASFGGAEDLDIPRTMSFDDVRVAAVAPTTAPLEMAPPAVFADELAIWVGVHIGTAGAYDAEHPCFLFGFSGRVRILEWLAAEATIDFQTKQKVEEGNAQGSIFQVPFMFAALFYAPIELPVRLYGIFGFGFTITDVSAQGGRDDTDANSLFFLGFGAEFELAKNLILDGNLRFVFAGDPPHTGDFSADWAQFTIGILLKLTN